MASTLYRTCSVRGKASCHLVLSWWTWIVRALVAFRAFIVRGMFLIYSILGVWTLVSLENRRTYWFLLLTVLPLLAELCVEIALIWKKSNIKRKRIKWFSPVILLFLGCACPPIWFGELHLHRKSVSNNSALQELTKHIAMLENEAEKLLANFTNVGMENNEEGGHAVDKILSVALDAMTSVHPEDRVRILEQILLLTLIFGRWLLPRGGITRDQLSQLLLVNIGMAADTLELFEAFKEPIVRQNSLLVVALLCLWQASLLQFSLIKTATLSKTKKMRPAQSLENISLGGGGWEFPSSVQIQQSSGCLFCETELWAICCSLALQDAPFLAMRMTLILKYNVLSYSNVFFTCKNTLVLLLQIFRMIVILLEYHDKQHRQDEDAAQELGITAESGNRALWRPSIAVISRMSVSTPGDPQRRKSGLQAALNSSPSIVLATSNNHLSQAVPAATITRLPHSRSDVAVIPTRRSRLLSTACVHGLPDCRSTSLDISSPSFSRDATLDARLTSSYACIEPPGTAPLPRPKVVRSTQQTPRIILRAAYRRQADSVSGTPNICITEGVETAVPMQPFPAHYRYRRPLRLSMPATSAPDPIVFSSDNNNHIDTPPAQVEWLEKNESNEDTRQSPELQ